MNIPSETRSLKYRSCFNSENESVIDMSAKDKLYRTTSLDHQDPTYHNMDSLSTTNDTSASTSRTGTGKKEETNTINPDGYVGFANLPNQVYWKAVKKGFEYTIMVVGESGLGKSTLINTMFHTNIYDPYPKRRADTISVEATEVVLKEGGVKLKLTIVDTPGFGDALNNTDCWSPIIDYIESKYEDYFQAETKLHRNIIPDQRVHCCLFCIQPYGHGLKQLDIEFMKRLCDKVNIVPIITKADTLTSEERDILKKKILEEIIRNDIRLYEFPELPKEDEDYELNNSLREKVPFAVVGSNSVLEVDGKQIRGREYPWGVVDIENMEHCDFTALKKMLICTHMQNLKDVTHTVHYEKYRYNKLCKEDIGEAEDRLSKLELEMEKELAMKSECNLGKLKKYEEVLIEEYKETETSVKQLQSEVERLGKLYELARAEMEEAKNKLSEMVGDCGGDVSANKKNKKGLF